MRSALGAGRSRIVAQMLTESLVLATLGGVLGVGFGVAILKRRTAVIPAGLLPAAATLAFDSRVVAFCAAASLSAGVLFGLVPAWQSHENVARAGDLLRKPIVHAKQGDGFGTCSSPAKSRQRCSCCAAPDCCCARCSPSETTTPDIAPTATAC